MNKSIRSGSDEFSQTFTPRNTNSHLIKLKKCNPRHNSQRSLDKIDHIGSSRSDTFGRRNPLSNKSLFPNVLDKMKKEKLSENQTEKNLAALDDDLVRMNSPGYMFSQQAALNELMLQKKIDSL